MSNKQPCPIWGTSATVEAQTEYPDLKGTSVDSPRTDGKYFITREAEELLKSLNEPTKAKAHLTSWLIDQRLFGVECPKIEVTTVKDAEQRLDLPIHERADRLLKHLRQMERYVGHRFVLPIDNRDDRFLNMLAWCESAVGTSEVLGQKQEIEIFLDYLETQGWISSLTDVRQDRHLRVEGYAHLADLEATVTDSSKVFVAMWFDESMESAWEQGIKPAVEDSGYKPLRIDRKEHLNKIDDEIIAEIRRSRFIIADFTHGDEGARGGVYYEAGFAHGLNIPVIFTCRKDALKKVHFDTRQYKHIVWKEPKDLRHQLEISICAVIGDGPFRHSDT